MESQDYDLTNEETKQEVEREIYNDFLGDLKQGLDNCFRQANIDELDLDDVVKAIEECFEGANDMKIKVERV